MTATIFEALGEDAVLLRLGDGIDEDTNRRVHALAAALDANRPDWLLEVVPAYASVALRIDTGRIGTGLEPAQYVRRWWLARPPADDGAREIAPAPLQVPVCYGGEFGPDLVAVAAHAGCSEDELIARHLAGRYQVAMLGFAPGFPYLLGLDPALAMPRMDTPRTRVPAGSVGIGGAQTGIYPREGPGGWRLIGRTPLALFDATRAEPSLLRPGQQVRFVQVDTAEFERLATAAKRRRPA